MKRFHPSPALVISLVALFVALGGTSYAAITRLPANSVGTKQIKNSAVTAAKLNAKALAQYLKYGGTLPSGKTEVGAWGFGSDSTEADPLFSFPVPLAAAIAFGHAIFVSGASATHCSGVGHADPGYLCVYDDGFHANANAPASSNIFDPEAGQDQAASAKGWGITLFATGAGDWSIYGSYAVTAP